MEVKAFGRVGAWLCTVALSLCSAMVLAKPGIDHRFTAPNYNDGRLNLDVLDLQVQALGGPIRILRSWKNGQWVWNERWSDLEVLGAADATAPQGAADPLNADRPYAVVRAGQSYLRASSTVQGQDVSFNNLPQRTLVALQHGLAGYRWQDLQGNRSEYNTQGKLTAYVDHNGLKVSLERNAAGQIVALKDHHGDTLITLIYSDNNLVSAKDYSGREVKYEYSGAQLTAVTDVLGKRWQYHYDGNGLAGYTDPLDQRTTYVLAAKDKVQEQRLPDGRTLKFSYGYEEATEQYYLRQIDQAGLVKEQWYDRLGHLVRQQEAGETLFTRQYLLSDRSSDVSKVAEAYRITGRSLAVTREISQRQGRAPSPYVAQQIEEDAHGNRTTTEYNSFNQIIRVLYADGSEIKKSYDPASNRLSEEISERGIKTQYRYDAKGNRTQLIEAAGTPDETVTTYRYNELGQLIGENRPGDTTYNTPAASWTYRYDSKGNRVAIVDPLNNETIYTFDALGNLLTLTNALKRAWTSAYDAAGNLLTLKTPVEQLTQFHYDALGQRTKITAPNGAELTTELSAAGLAKSITDAAQARTQFEYDSSQRLTAVIDPLNNKTERQYDARGRLKASKDEAGNSTAYRYDKERLAGVEYPTYQEQYDYDNRERIKAETRQFDENGTAITQRDQYRFLADGSLEQWKDAAENPTGSNYDSLGRLSASTDAVGSITRYACDKRGNLSQVTDPTGRLTQFKYDARDSVIAEIKPGDAKTARTERTYTYDAVGNLSQVTTPDGHVSHYRYDAANRLIELRHYNNVAEQQADNAERTITYRYTVLNRLADYEDEESQAIYEHDSLGRVTRTTITYKTANPVFSKTFGYSYDLNGRKATYSNPEGQTYGYRYTTHGQLAGVTIPDEGSISYQDYRWLQPQSVLYPGGSSLRIVYDGLLRYSQRILKDPAGNPIQTQGYSYDPVGNITAIDSQDGKTDYGYDKLYRLTAAQYSQGDSRTNEAYAYDGVGNRLDEAVKKEELDIGQWQYNAHNQLTNHDGIGYRYNRDGHLIERGALQPDQSLKQSGDIDHWQYQYDSRERLTEVSKNDQVIAQYGYNPLGQRIRKTLPQESKTTYYLYSDEGLVAEYDEQGNLKQEYAYDPTEPWMRQPLFVRAKQVNRQDFSVSYYGTSHLGTPEVAFLKSGEVTWRAKAQVFGETQVALNLINNPLRFPGQYYDQETGLHYNYFRDYDSLVGRYVQSDPIGLRGGLNTYGYAGGNSVVLYDLLGLEWARKDFFNHYNNGGGQAVTLAEIGLLHRFVATESVSGAMSRVFKKGESKLVDELKAKCKNSCYADDTVSAEVETREFDESYDVTGGYWPSDMEDGLFSIGRGSLYNMGRCTGKMNCTTGKYSGNCSIHFYIRDSFEDPWDVINVIPGGIETGTPYKIRGDWVRNHSFTGP